MHFHAQVTLELSLTNIARVYLNWLNTGKNPLLQLLLWRYDELEYLPGCEDPLRSNRQRCTARQQAFLKHCPSLEVGVW